MEKASVGQGTRVAVVFTGIVLVGIGVTSVISDSSVAKHASMPDSIVMTQPPAAGPAAPVQEPSPPPAADAAAATAPAAPTAAASAPAAAPAPAAAASAGDKAQGDVKEMVQAWRSAWARRDADAYIGYYVAGYQGGADSADHWQAGRKRIIGQAKYIDIQLGEPKIELKGDSQATVSVPFTYVSDRLKDHGTKVLEVRRDGGKWLIEREAFTAN